MRIKGYIALLILSLAAVGFVSSCNDDIAGVPGEPLLDSPYIDGIGVTLADLAPGISTRASEGDQEMPSDQTFDVDTLMPYTLEFNDNSVIQVSQKTRTEDPFRTDAETYDFSYIPLSNLDPSADPWSDPNSYNFGAAVEDDPLEWNKIGEKGSWNGGFALFSLYFPLENQLRQKDGGDGTIHYSVMKDQSIKDNLIKSDILGGYHSTSTLFSRIRFRMFHLMTYLRIRLYVPVYDEDEDTGYRDGALQYATINNVNPDFAIEWNAIRSSDTEGPKVSPVEGSDEIKMYQHPIPDGLTSYPITEINYRDFYADQGLPTGNLDKVRIYDFSVIIPLQKSETDADGNVHNFAETQFLNFFFKSNSGAINKYYFTQANQPDYSDRDPDNPPPSSNLELTQGRFQFLELYVPRVGNKVVYLGAKVNNWGKMGTEMVLTPEPEEE